MNARFQLSLALVLSALSLASCGGEEVSETSTTCTPACDASTESCENGVCVKLCGNGILDAGEDCDGGGDEVLFADKKTCSDLDMEGEALTCDASCKIDSSACKDKQEDPKDPNPPEVQSECEDGDKKCETSEDGSTAFRTCSGGKWDEGTACESSCDNDKGCIECAEVGKCEAATIDDGNGGTYEGYRYYACTDNTWDEGIDCEASCDNVKGCVCTENATKCDNNVFRTCVNGEWEEGTPCEQSCDHIKGCVACINGDVQCGTRKKIDPETLEETEEEETYMLQCVGDAWQEEGTVCELQCIDGKGCTQCEGEAVKCENGAIYTCTDGFWSEPVSCGENIECKDETTCAECVSSARKCENGMESICTDGVWSEATACPDNASCNEDGTACLGCNTGSKKCEIDKQYNCINSEWDDGEYCAMGFSCRDDGKSCGMCMNDSKKCEDGKLYTCKQGVWADEEECASGLGCVDSTRCRECSNNQSECVKDTDNEYRSCFNGMWDRNEKCQAGYQCSQTNATTAECVPGDNFCTPSKDKYRCTGTNSTTLEKCESTYKWTAVQTCPAKTVCHAESGACLDAFVAWNMDNVYWHSNDETESITPKKGINVYRTTGTVLEIYPSAKAAELNADNGFEFTYRKPANATNPVLNFTFNTYKTGGCTKAQVRINGKNVGNALNMQIGSKGFNVPLDTAKDGDKIDLLFYGNTGTYCGRFGNININATYIGKTRSITQWQYLTPVVSSKASYGLGEWTTVSLPVYVSGLNSGGNGYVQMTSRNTTEANPDKYLRFDTSASGYNGVKLYLETYRNDTGPSKVQVDFYANNSPEVAFTTTLTLDKQSAWQTHVIDLGDKIDDKNVVQIQINPYKASSGSGYVNFRKISLLGKKVTCSKNGAVRCTGDNSRQIQVCDGKVYNLKSECGKDEICNTGNGGVCKKKYMSLTFDEIWYDANTQNNVSGNPHINTLKAKGFGVSMNSNGLYLSRGYGQTYMESASKQVTFSLSTAGYGNKIIFKFKVQRINAESAKTLRFLLDGAEQHVIPLSTIESGYQTFELPLSNATDKLKFELIMRVYGESSTDANFRGALRFDDIQLISRNGSKDTVIAGWDFNSNKLEFRPQFGEGSFARNPASTTVMGYWNSSYISFSDAGANVTTPNKDRYSEIKVKKDTAKNAVFRLNQSSNPQSYTKVDAVVNNGTPQTITVPHSGSKEVVIKLPKGTAEDSIKLYYYNASESPNKQFYTINVIEE